VSDKFAFIDSEYAAKIEYHVPAPTIGRMCVLLEVSRSGYYEWLERPTSATAQRRSTLGLLIVKSFEDSNQTYGYRRRARRPGRLGCPGRPGAGPVCDG
jgi:putative transposase